MAMLLKPIGSWNEKLVALCDGHGMQTPGKRTPYIPELGREIRENEFNRNVVGFLADILLDHGFRVLLVAPTDTDTPLSYRTDAANRQNADIYVSVHFNAMSFDFDYSSADGISVHVYLNNMKYDSGKLARAVGKYLRQGTKQDWRGFKEDNFHVLRETNMPAILTENGFMDDRREALLMLNEDFQLEVATEHAKGICEYFDVEYKGHDFDPMNKGYLIEGDQGESVKDLQRKLNRLGYSLKVDGIYGSKTAGAVASFQTNHSLQPDESYGPKTQKALDKALKRYASVANKEEEEAKVDRDINQVSEWAKDDWKEATENGYFDGKRPGAEITREETSIVVNRLRDNFLELIKKNEEEIERLRKALEDAGVEIPEE